MRFKPLPEPPTDLEELRTVLSAVPADPAATDDCCARLCRRTHLADRDEAADWLTLLRALQLVTRGSDGYARVAPTRTNREDEPSTRADRVPPGGLGLEAVQRAFRERVDGAEPVLDALERADQPQSASTVAHCLESRSADGSRSGARSTDRVGRLLEWAVLLELAERRECGRYTV